MRRATTMLLVAFIEAISVSVAAADDPPATDSVPNLLAGSSITCSTAWPSATLGCWWERPVLVLGDVELALGVDAQVVLSGSWDDAHLAPYFVLAWYGPQVGAWLEARLPDLPGVPLLGTSDCLRAGITIRIPP